MVARWEKKEEDGQTAKTEAVLRSIFGPFTEKEKEEQRRRLEESCPAMYRDEEGDTEMTGPSGGYEVAMRTCQSMKMRLKARPRS